MAMSRTRKVALVIVALVLALVLAVGAGLALLFMSFGAEPSVRDNSVLVLKVEGMLPDYAAEDPLAARFFGASSNSLTALLTQLRKAKADGRVGAVLLDVGLLGVGWAKAEELRGAVADLRSSGKPVYAYMEFGGDKEYYVAAAAERVYVPPVGDLYVNGLAAQAIFLRGSFDKLGVEWDIYKIGKYKSAPEQYTEKKMSEAARENINWLVDDIFNRYVAAVARDRRKSEEDVRALIDRAPLRSRDAVEAGLIDGALYRDDVERELKKRLGYKDDEKLRKVTGAEYKQVSPESVGLESGERVAVVYATGDIVPGESDDGSFGGDQTAGSDTLVRALNQARDDKSVKAIVLRVDSPGGVTFPSDLIWNAVRAAKEKKPVVVSMGDLAASGGYYISMGASRVLAQPSTLTGSIGVYAGKPVIKGFYDWIGVSNEYVMRGKNAGIFRETEKFTPEERARFEETINRFYWDEFVPKAADGRKLDPEYVDSVAQGRVWTGAQGRDKKLVDEIGGLDRAVEVAKELAGIPADKGVRRVVFPAPRTLLQSFFGAGGEEDSASLSARQQRQALLDAMPADMRRAFRYVATFDRAQRGEALAVMPFELEIK